MTLTFCRHAPTGAKYNCAPPPPSSGKTPSPAALADATSSLANSHTSWQEILKFHAKVQKDSNGKLPLLSPTEWHRQFLAWRAAKNRPPCTHRAKPIVAVGRQRVTGRSRRPQRRPSGVAKSNASSDDGGGEGPPRRARGRRNQQVAPSARAAS